MGPLEGANAERLDEALWAALRILEERRDILERMALSSGADTSTADRFAETERYVGTLRQLLAVSESTA